MNHLSNSLETANLPFDIVLLAIAPEGELEKADFYVILLLYGMYNTSTTTQIHQCPYASNLLSTGITLLQLLFGVVETCATQQISQTKKTNANCSIAMLQLLHIKQVPIPCQTSSSKPDEIAQLAAAPSRAGVNPAQLGGACT